jgi:hypothetical protein
MHRLKALGFCTVAVFAMTAVLAAGAQAAPEYKSESSPTFLFGESTDNVFTITHSPENLEFRCSKTKLSGEVVGTSVKTVSVHPEYTGCELNEIPAKVETKSCNYRLNQPTSLGTTPPSWTITVSILTCPSTAPIKVTFSGCTIEVSESGNSVLSHVILTWTGTTTGRHIHAELTLGGLTAKQSSGCPGGAGTFATADYAGTIDLKGYTSAAHTTKRGIWIE